MPHPPEQIVRGIRLPRTSSRVSAQCFAKLLNHVDPEASNGFGFEGKIMRPGKIVTESDLYPPEYPAAPILLEYAGGIKGGGIKDGSRSAHLYILWRYERADNRWVELARASSVSWDWAVDLRPLAIRALREARGNELQVLPNLVVIAGRISLYLDTTLKPLESSDRGRVLAILHDQFASRLAAAM